MLCTACHGSGAAPGTEPITCETCRGQGEVAHVQRSFLGEIRTLRPCAACRGYGSIIPEPCRECSGDGRVRSRRTLTVKIPAGVDTGTRVQLTEQGEVGPGGGPAGDLYVEIRVARARRVHPSRQRPALHRHGADDRRGARHDAAPADARGRRRGRRRVGRGDGVRARGPPRHPVRHRVGAAGRGVPGLRGGRGDLVVGIVVETPTRLDPRQEELLTELAAIRGEEQPTAQVRPGNKSVFGRIRDAFNTH